MEMSGSTDNGLDSLEPHVKSKKKKQPRSASLTSNYNIFIFFFLYEYLLNSFLNNKFGNIIFFVIFYRNV